MSNLDLRRIDPETTTVVAELDRDGRLLKVDEADFRDKWAAIMLATRPLRTVFVSAEQPLDGIRHPLLPNTTDRRVQYVQDTECTLIQARTLQEAIQCASAHQRVWGMVDYSVELARLPRPYVGRGWLDEKIKELLQGEEDRYLVLRAEESFGKTTFIRKIAADKHSVSPVGLRFDTVFHFVTRDYPQWDQPTFVHDTLRDQLLRLLPPASRLEAQRNKESLHRVLQRVSDCFRGRRVLICLDGVDQLPGDSPMDAVLAMLPRHLPRGIRVLLTSEAPLPEWDEIPIAKDNLDNDVRGLIEMVNDAPPALGLDDDQIEQLVASSEGSLAAAAAILSDSDSLNAWKERPYSLVQHFAKDVEQHWSQLEQQAKQAEIPLESVKLIMGILATAVDPTLGQLLALLRRGFHASPDARIGMAPLEPHWVHLAAVLTLARKRFLKPDSLQKPASLQFTFSAYRAYVLSRLTSLEQSDCHRFLMHCCRDSNEPGTDDADDYALRHRFAHTVGAKEWEAVVRLFDDLEFIARKLARGSMLALHSEMQSALAAMPLAHDLRPQLQEMEEFLRRRMHRVAEDDFVQEYFNEFEQDPVQDEPRLLARKEPGCPASLADAGHQTPLRYLGVWCENNSSNVDYLVSAAVEPTLKVWNADTGKLTVDCGPQNGAIRSVAISRRGWIVSGSWDGAIRVWDPRTGSLRHELSNEQQVTAVTACPQTDLCAALNTEGQILLFDAATGEEKHRSETLGASELDFSLDGSLLFVATDGGHFEVLDGLKGHSRGWIHTKSGDAQWQVVGNEIAVVGPDESTVTLFDRASGRKKLPGQLGKIERLATCGQGCCLAAGAKNGLLWWRLPLGNQEFYTLQPKHPHDATLTGLAIARGCSSLAAAWDHEVNVWETERVLQHDHDPSSHFNVTPRIERVLVLPDDRVAVGMDEGELMIRDPSSGEETRLSQGKRALINTADIDPTGALVAMGTEQGAVRVQAVMPGEPEPEVRSPEREDDAHSQPVRRVRFSPNGTQLASVGNDRQVRVLDLPSGTVQRWEDVHQDDGRDVIYCGDHRLVTGETDQCIRYLDLKQDNAEWLDARQPDHTIRVLAWCPHSQRLISGDRKGYAWPWVWEDGKLRQQSRWLVSDRGVVALHCSDDGLLAASSDSGLVKLWNMKTPIPSLVQEFMNEEIVRSVAFSDSGKLLASGGKTVSILRRQKDGLFVHHTRLYFAYQVIAMRFLPLRPGFQRLIAVDRAGHVYAYQIAETT